MQGLVKIDMPLRIKRALAYRVQNSMERNARASNADHNGAELILQERIKTYIRQIELAISSQKQAASKRRTDFSERMRRLFFSPRII